MKEDRTLPVREARQVFCFGRIMRFLLVLVVSLSYERNVSFAKGFALKFEKKSKENSATHVCRAGEMTCVSHVVSVG